MGAALIGAGIGMGKSVLIDKPKEERQRKLAAIQTLYSPWTGITPDKIDEADPMGSALQGGAMGAQYGQAQETAALNKESLGLQNDLTRSQIANMNRGGAMGAPMAYNYNRSPYAGAV